MNSRLERLAVAAFFALYLVVGIAIHSDYGASWDEPLNRDLGLSTFRYVEARLSGHSAPWSSFSRDLIAEQGPFFETVLVALEKILGLEDIRTILLMRHLATFVTFWLGTVAFYALMRMRFEDRKLALIGVALLALTPRLFAHSFYNSKDAVLTALFIVGTLTMLRFVRRRSFVNSALHALACAAAIDVRVVGLLLPGLTVLLLALAWARRDIAKREVRRNLAAAAIYLLMLAALVVALWPGLWESPFGRLLDTTRGLSAANQQENSFSLYFGDFVRVDRLPWHYLPVWMLITVPIPYWLFCLAGLPALGRSFAKNPIGSPENVQDLTFTLLFLVPLAAVIAVRPILYDDWRHLYFLHVPMLAVALTGIRDLAARPRLRKPVMAAVLLAILYGAGILVRYHPYQNVYFNLLAGPNVETRFELDYWGLSFREGLEFVLGNDPANPVRVHVSDYPGVVNSWLIEKGSRDRLRIGPLDEATYFLSNHRQPGHFADFRARRYPCVNEVYTVRAGGTTLLAVYKIR